MSRRRKMSFGFSAAALVAVLLLALWQGVQQQQGSTRTGRAGRVGVGESYPAEASVLSVADGDTFTTREGQVVRLLGMDTPEHGEPYSGQAGARLADLVLGRSVRLTYDAEKKDRYGRLLCHVHLGNLWVNELLVKEGLAVVYTVEPNFLKMDRLIRVQKDARERKAGIWSLPPPEPVEAEYVASAKGFRFHRPGCELARGIAARNVRKFKTRDAALDLGLSPCRSCHP